ncbi:hypothetical protein FSP39_011806 [Pinctada imbricata]|uniref:Integrase catalytic domain-containing protein n=1 Tax=Pinctada imbricata TaxID=66713 RepID=A0AA88XD17_PINIB|nr:hypothetical protein FSP39_011806 [Pinctada imbricata]
MAQMADKDIAAIFIAKENETRPEWSKISDGSGSLKTLWRMWDRIHILKGMMYRQNFSDDGQPKQMQLIIPAQYKSHILQYFHDLPSGGHLGAEKTLSRVRNSFYWPRMKKEVEEYCKHCDACSSRKPSRSSNRAPMRQYNLGEPMERVTVDILGPLPSTTKGNKYILVLCDSFTKWTEAFAIPDQEASTITKVFVNEFICRFGTPLQLHSDQGRSFEAKLFQDMCKLFRIHKTRTTSQRPQANGTVERFNRTLASMLSAYCKNNQREWDSYLPQVMMAYRSAVHSSTNATPNMMMLGRNIMMPLEAIIPRPPLSDDNQNQDTDYLSALQKQLATTHEMARKHLKKNSDYQKKYYDTKATRRDFEEGQPVWLYDASKKVGVCSKLTCKWKGPYVITKKIDDITFLVKRSRTQQGKIYHIDRLLPYKGRNPPTWFRK